MQAQMCEYDCISVGLCSRLFMYVYRYVHRTIRRRVVMLVNSYKTWAKLVQVFFVGLVHRVV